ncbi:glycosyl transferase [Bosea sp. 124]|uniref:glycosyl transferase n=1 Tax=Bosea sp. 124 TaxID=2135642 RepID=UPI000D3A4331|nr:glycosyl transferase [Bosea sp. 124]PTM40204.1 UDP-N-acetylmuramyl pentapeptide phosphotransferase/UDP-N-acetylglucosamine-1-phosphate transferase [Bosea sp. 124]
MERLAPLLILPLAAAISALLCVLLRPLLVRYALARPNARSSHRVPTPQGGGIAVLAGAFVALWLGLQVLPLPSGADSLAFVVVAAVALAVVGAWDDIRPLSAGLRFGLQALCVAVVIVYAAPDVRLFPEAMPLAVERCLALLAGIWFVNLTNFMDGIDWITVAGFVPLAGALALAGSAGLVDPGTALLAAALCGGLLGFAPFNKPTARLFLGDVGSLPIGLVTAYLLYRLAGTGALAAALILPLYHVADATITLLRRLARRERIWEAHRSHVYQQATTNGHGVLTVVTQIALLNLVLIGLATISIMLPAMAVQLACLTLALLLTVLLLVRFSRRAPAP